MRDMQLDAPASSPVAAIRAGAAVATIAAIPAVATIEVLRGIVAPPTGGAITTSTTLPSTPTIAAARKQPDISRCVNRHRLVHAATLFASLKGELGLHDCLGITVRAEPHDQRTSRLTGLGWAGRLPITPWVSSVAADISGHPRYAVRAATA